MSDSMDWTPGQCCREAAVECDSDDVNACLIIMLNRGESNDEYNTGFRNAGMTLSECVALLEVQKSRILEVMNKPLDE